MYYQKFKADLVTFNSKIISATCNICSWNRLGGSLGLYCFHVFISILTLQYNAKIDTP